MRNKDVSMLISKKDEAAFVFVLIAAMVVSCAGDDQADSVCEWKEVALSEEWKDYVNPDDDFDFMRFRLMDVHAASDEDVHILLAKSTFESSSGVLGHFDGTSCSTRQEFSDRPFWALGGDAADRVFAVSGAWPEGIAQYDGVDWTLDSSVPNIESPSGTETPDLTAVWAGNMGKAFAVGVFDSILEYDGGLWSTVSHSFEDWQCCDDVWGSDDGQVFVVGGDPENGPFIGHFDGAGWSEMLVDPAWPQLRAIWGLASDEVYAVGYGYSGNAQDNSCSVLQYDGVSWDVFWDCSLSGSESLGIDLGSIWGTSSSDIYVASEGGGVWHYDGRDWSREKGVPGATALSGCSSKDVFAVTPTGLWQKSCR